MAHILSVYVIDAGDGNIKVKHEFYGLTREEAETYFREHQACGYLKAAVQEGRARQEWEEVSDDELPYAEDFE